MFFRQSFWQYNISHRKALNKIRYGASSIICIPDNHGRDREREIGRKRFQLKEMSAFEVVYFIVKCITLKKTNIFKQYRAARTRGLILQFFSNCRKKWRVICYNFVNKILNRVRARETKTEKEKHSLVWQHRSRTVGAHTVLIHILNTARIIKKPDYTCYRQSYLV